MIKLNAILNKLIKLADDLDRTENEELASSVDEIITDLSQEVEIEIPEDEESEIRSILEETLKSLQN